MVVLFVNIKILLGTKINNSLYYVYIKQSAATILNTINVHRTGEIYEGIYDSPL